MGNSNRSYRLSPLAIADLEEIWIYTFRQWSLEQADIYHEHIITAIAGLSSGHNIGQQTTVRAGYWKYKVGRHIVYFKISDKHLDVIRILHEVMDVELHLQNEE